MVALAGRTSARPRWRATPAWVYGAAMDEVDPAPVPRRPEPALPEPALPEPPLIERARRTGWALLGVSLAAALVARFGPPSWSLAAWAATAAAGLAGMLAIVNVALVRGLYRELAVRREAGGGESAPADPPQSM